MPRETPNVKHCRSIELCKNLTSFERNSWVCVRTGYLLLRAPAKPNSTNAITTTFHRRIGFIDICCIQATKPVYIEKFLLLCDGHVNYCTCFQRTIYECFYSNQIEIIFFSFFHCFRFNEVTRLILPSANLYVRLLTSLRADLRCTLIRHQEG